MELSPIQIASACLIGIAGSLRDVSSEVSTDIIECVGDITRHNAVQEAELASLRAKLEIAEKALAAADVQFVFWQATAGACAGASIMQSGAALKEVSAALAAIRGEK